MAVFRTSNILANYNFPLNAALGEYIKLLLVVFFILFSSLSYSEGIELRVFESHELPQGQSGCWYYLSQGEKQKGKIIAVGESQHNAIYFIINGKKIGVGNWKSDYREKYHDISYSDDAYLVSIHSNILSESRYSSQYESTITISTKDYRKTIKAFGECGS